MKILLVYPGQRSSTFDVAFGYHEALAMLGHQVYPYYFHDWLDYHEGALKWWAAKNPHFGLNQKEADDAWIKLASEYLIVTAVEFQPDVILIVHGLLLHPHTYVLLKRLGVPRAIILTECPYIDDEQLRMLEAADFDHIFVNDQASRGLGTYLPHSYSRLRHRPGRVTAELATDVYFHGTWFEERETLFGGLKRNPNGYNIRIVGVGWKDGVGDTQVATPNSQLVARYQSTKIALNQHRTTATIGENRRIQGQSLGPRAYEIVACGAFQLCDNTRLELHEIFGDSVATYRNRDDLINKIDYYLAHESERLEMVRTAYARVLPCSFTNRAADILIPALEAL